MAEILRFEPNVPAVLELKFDSGLESQGSYGPQMMFTLADDRIIFVPLTVAAEMDRLQIRKGLRFRITKQSIRGSRGFNWLVERLDIQPPGPPEQKLSDSAAVARTGQRPGSSPAAAVSTVAPAVPITNGTSSPQNKPAPSGRSASNLLASCHIVAIDSLILAREYAAAKGWKLEFNEEDVRASANAVYIQHFRDIENSLRYSGYQARVEALTGNGGTQRWAQ